MEDAHRPLPYSPYTHPDPAILDTQRELDASHLCSLQQSPQEPLPPMPHPNDQPPSAEQPSLICGFTLTELAHVAIQVTGVTIAAIFGAWAVKAYDVANRLSEDSLHQSDLANRLALQALKQSVYANNLAIINLCLTDQYRDSADCPTILQQSRFSSIVYGVMPTLSTTTQQITRSTLTISPPPLSTTIFTATGQTTAATRTIVIPTTTDDWPSLLDSKQSGSGVNLFAAIIIGVVVAVVVFCLLLIWYRRAKRSRF